MKKIKLEINQEIELNKETTLKYEKEGVKYKVHIKAEEMTIANNLMNFINEIKDEKEEKEKGRARRESKLKPTLKP